MLSYVEVHFAAKPQHGLGKKERRRIAEVLAEIDRLIGNEETESRSPKSRSSESTPSPAVERERSLARDEQPIDVAQPIQEWTSERLRKIMQKASVRGMGVKIHPSAWRQVAIAASRRYCRENSFQSEDPSQEVNTLDEETIDDDPWDLQTSHGTHVAGMIYARELTEGSNVVIGRREKFRHIS